MKYFFIVILSFLSLAWLLPNHYNPWITSHSDFCAFISLILTFGLVVYYSNSIKIPVRVLPLLFIIFIPLLQYLFGIVFFLGDSIITTIYIYGFFCAMIVGYNLVQQSKKKKKIYLVLFSTILFVSIVSVFIALMQWLLQSNGQIWFADFPANARPFANFGQPNTLATFLIMGLMSLLYLFEKQRLNIVSASIIALLIIFAIALTQSRTSWLFALCFIIWFLWKIPILKTRINKKKLGLFIGFYILYILVLPIISNFIGINNTVNALIRVSTGLERLTMWKQMLIAIQNQPWFGYGWNQVGVAQVNTTIEYPVQMWTEHSHNILLDLLIWNGIPLGIAIIGFLGWWLYQLIKLSKTIESFIALSMIGAVLVHAMLEYPLEYAFFLLPVGFLLGLVQAEDKAIGIIIIPKSILILTLLLSVVFYICIFMEYRIIEKDVQLARFESLNIGDIYATKAAPDVIILTQLREKIRFVRTPPKENMTSDQLEWMHHISYRYATQSMLYKYAQALALNNQPELAKKQLLILEKLHGVKYSFESLFQINKSLVFEWQNQSTSKP